MSRADRHKLPDGAVRKEHICIITPTLTQEVGLGVDWLLSKSVAMTYSPNCPYFFSQQRIQGAKPVEYMWNRIAQNFLRTDATRLWKIDNDMYPLPGDNIFKLLEVDADIVAGTFFRARRDGDLSAINIQICAFDVDPETNVHRVIQPPPDAPEVQECDAVGGGCVIIRREVLEDPRMRLGDSYIGLDGKEHTLGPDEAPAIFRRLQAPNGQVIVSADLDFCARAKALGYKVAVHLGVPVDQKVHVGLNSVVAAMPGIIPADNEEADEQPRIVAAQ